MSRHPLLIILFLVTLALTPGASAMAAPDHSISNQSAAVQPSVASLPAAADGGTTYLNKLFGDFVPTAQNPAGNNSGAPTSGPLEWFLIVFGTIVYGQIVLFVVLWILFTADLLGIIVALVLIAICVNFVLRRKPRAIALFVLACVNFILGSAITLVVAFTEGLPTVLVSLIPLGALVWLALRQITLQFKAIVKP